MAKSEFFEDGVNLYENKNIMRQSLNLNKILYLIQKTKDLIYI